VESHYRSGPKLRSKDCHLTRVTVYSLSEFSMGIHKFPMTPEEGMNSRANAAPFKGFGEKLSLVSP
jgi:hypothetical protein